MILDESGTCAAGTGTETSTTTSKTLSSTESIPSPPLSLSSSSSSTSTPQPEPESQPTTDEIATKLRQLAIQPQQPSSTHTTHTTEHSNLAPSPDSDPSAAVETTNASPSPSPTPSPSSPSSSSSSSSCYPRTDLVIKFLPPSITHDTLYSLFSPYGHIRSCKLIRDKYTGVSLGYGFITYQEEWSAQQAVQRWNGAPLDGKVLRVSIARPIEQVRADRQQQHDPMVSIIIHGLPINWGKLAIETFFGAYGEIVECRILDSSPRPQLSTTTSAYVRYANETCAITAVQMTDGQMLPDQRTTLIVKTIRDNAAKLSPSLDSQQILSTIPQAPLQSLNIRIPSDGTIPTTVHYSYASIQSTPYDITNIYEQRWTTSAQTPDGTGMVPVVFPSYNGFPTATETTAHLSPSIPTQDPYSTSFHWMYPTASIPTAVPSVPMHHRISSTPSTPSMTPSTLTSRLYANGYTDIIKTSSPSKPSRKHGSIERPGICLFVFHLPPEYKDMDLFNLFCPYGTVLCCKVMEDATTTSRGFGFVNMATMEDAHNAIENIHGKHIGNKFLKVSLKQKPKSRSNSNSHGLSKS